MEDSFTDDNDIKTEEDRIISSMPDIEKSELDEDGQAEYQYLSKYLGLKDGELVYFEGIRAYKVVSNKFRYSLGEHKYDKTALKAILRENEKVDSLIRYATKNRNMQIKPTLNKYCYLTNATSQDQRGFKWRKDLEEHSGSVKNLSANASELKVVFDRDTFSYNCYLPIIPIIKSNNKLINQYLEATFKEDLQAIKDWMSIYTFENRYEISRPTLLLKSNKRGTGKNTFLEAVMSQIYRGVSSEVTFTDDFNEWADSKLAFMDEASDTRNDIAKVWDISKQISGQAVIKVNGKYQVKNHVSNGVYFVMMSNEPKPIHIKDAIIDEAKNQVLVIDMIKDDKTDKIVEKIELNIHKLGYFHFKDFFHDHLGHWLFTDLLEHYKELRQRTKSKPYRYGMPVPITNGLKQLIQMSLSSNDISILKALEDLYYQNTDPYQLTEYEKTIFTMFAAGTPAPENLKGYVPFSILMRIAKENRFDMSAFKRFTSKLGWLYKDNIRIKHIKGYSEKTTYGILINIKKLGEYIEEQSKQSQLMLTEIKESPDFKGSFKAAHPESNAVKEPGDDSFRDSFDFEEEMNEIDSLIGIPAKDDDNSPL